MTDTWEYCLIQSDKTIFVQPGMWKQMKNNDFASTSLEEKAAQSIVQKVINNAADMEKLRHKQLDVMSTLLTQGWELFQFDGWNIVLRRIYKQIEK